MSDPVLEFLEISKKIKKRVKKKPKKFWFFSNPPPAPPPPRYGHFSGQKNGPPFLAALAALCPPLWLINSFMMLNYITSADILYNTNHSKPWIFKTSTKFSEFQPDFRILSKFHDVDQISQFWLNFTILTKFHNFDQISQFWPNITILTKLNNFDQFTILTKYHNVNNFTIVKISQFQPNFTGIPLWT